MAFGIDEKLESLKVAIEELREELHSAIVRSDGRLDGTRTYEISANLDKLVAQFLRIKEKLEGERARESVPPPPERDAAEA